MEIVGGGKERLTDLKMTIIPARLERAHQYPSLQLINNSVAIRIEAMIVTTEQSKYDKKFPGRVQSTWDFCLQVHA